MQNSYLLPQCFVHRGHGLQLLAQVQVLGAQIPGRLLFAFQRHFQAGFVCAWLSAAQAANLLGDVGIATGRSESWA